MGLCSMLCVSVFPVTTIFVTQQHIHKMIPFVVLPVAILLLYPFAMPTLAAVYVVPLELSENGVSVMSTIEVGSRCDRKDRCGDDPQKVRLIVDTGSTSLWVFGTDAEDEIGADGFEHVYYQCKKSKTCLAKVLPKNWSKTAKAYYGDGDWYKGKLVSETIQFVGGGGTPWEQTPLAVMDTFGNKRNPQHVVATTMDGMLGLSPFVHKLNKSKMKPIFKHLIDEGLLDNEVFALYWPPMGTNKGELTLGGINKELYTGDLNYFPVIPEKGVSENNVVVEEYNAWSLTLGSARLGGDNTFGNNVLVHIDSGANQILVSKTFIKHVVKHYKTNADIEVIKTGPSGRNSAVMLACNDRNKLDDLVITFGEEKVEYRLTPEELFLSLPSAGADEYCMSVMVGHPGNEETPWSLGLPFLRKYLSVYDYGQKSVGLALSSQGKNNKERRRGSSTEQTRGKTLLLAPNAFNDDSTEIQGDATVTNSSAYNSNNFTTPSTPTPGVADFARPDGMPIMGGGA